MATTHHWALHGRYLSVCPVIEMMSSAKSALLLARHFYRLFCIACAIFAGERGSKANFVICPGSVATVLALLMRSGGAPPGLGPISCIAIGPPPVLSQPLAELCNDFVTSVILGYFFFSTFICKVDGCNFALGVFSRYCLNWMLQKLSITTITSETSSTLSESFKAEL